MSVEIAGAWETATHIMQLVAAHGLVEAGKGPVVRGARAVVDWLHRHLPAEHQGNLTTVLASPGPSRARSALEGQIGGLLEERPALLAEVLTVLKRETGDHIAQTMTLGDNNRGGIQNTGSNVSIAISG